MYSRILCESHKRCRSPADDFCPLAGRDTHTCMYVKRTNKNTCIQCFIHNWTHNCICHLHASIVRKYMPISDAYMMCIKYVCAYVLLHYMHICMHVYFMNISFQQSSMHNITSLSLSLSKTYHFNRLSCIHITSLSLSLPHSHTIWICIRASAHTSKQTHILASWTGSLIDLTLKLNQVNCNQLYNEWMN